MFFSQKLFWSKITGWREKKKITRVQGRMILSTFQLEGEEVTNLAFQKVKKAKKDKVNLNLKRKTKWFVSIFTHHIHLGHTNYTIFRNLEIFKIFIFKIRNIYFSEGKIRDLMKLFENILFIKMKFAKLIN